MGVAVLLLVCGSYCTFCFSPRFDVIGTLSEYAHFQMESIILLNLL